VKQKAKSESGQPALVVDSEVVRLIRQHARSSNQAEICGVLVGKDRDSLVEVQACIAGANAEEAGAHVTFTQATWEHIYKIKDERYPNLRIVGWYHSHPGFGVFLSEHDTFIHKNFFSSPGQVAWVFDPHSDEEGCFGWANGRIERLTRIAVADRRGGEQAEGGSPAEPSYSAGSFPDRPSPDPERRLPVEASSSTDLEANESGDASLQRLTTAIFSHLTVLVLGFLLCWFIFPRLVGVPIPVDPRTGLPLPGYGVDSGPGAAPGHPGQTDPNPSKGDNVRSK
jgi:proteasome lid subunit RPN8/RPN11